MANDEKEFRSLLQARRAELLVLIDSAAEASATVELDQQVQGRLSRMDAIQGQAMAQVTSKRRRKEKTQIDAALGRKEEGEIGYCVECGEEIAEKRRRLTPAVARCGECA